MKNATFEWLHGIEFETSGNVLEDSDSEMKKVSEQLKVISFCDPVFTSEDLISNQQLPKQMQHYSES